MRAAAVQLTSTEDFDRNLAVADRLCRAAVADGASLVVLPEKWPGYGSDSAVRAAAERSPEVLAWATASAKEWGIDLIAGSVPVLDGDRIRNTCFHVGPDGSVLAEYVKLHLFDVDVGDRSDRESDTDDAGDAPVTTEVQGVRTGLAICYDLRFPTLFEALRADIIALPSAFTEKTTDAHWDVLVRARAIEQQAFVIGANQVGEHAKGVRSGGRSMIVDPWGTVLAQAPDGETHVIADLDLDDQRAIRAKMPALQHRRNEVLA